jgi:type VI secretion system protein VasG
MNVDLRSLIDKLNHETRSAVEGAAGLCLSRTHYDVEIEHYLLKLLDLTDGDFAAILRHFEVDRSRLSGDLTEALDTLKTGNAKTPSLSPSLVEMLKEAWTAGSLEFGAGQVRSGFTILALAGDDDLRRRAVDASRELDKIKAEELQAEFRSIVAGSSEEAAAARTARSAPAGPEGGGEGEISEQSPHLDQYTRDLTAWAREGRLDPVLGRDQEIRQIVDVLTRRRQNNPILVGEAGVGKTAIVEGFAMRIAEGDVPPPLRNVAVHNLDLALLQAGASMKGEFEERLKGLIDEVKSSPRPVVLFIDEAHTLIGAGGDKGGGDAANLLKPALARGELRTVAATTWSEYKKYIEKDPALTRRFQPVKVDEPTEEGCMVMMRGILPHLESHHGVRILAEGMEAAVRLSNRYLPDRQLPDKAVTVLDTACARLALGQSATPPPVEDARRRLQDIAKQTRVLRRERAVGVDHSERLDELEEERATTEEEIERLEKRWEEERELVARVRAIRRKLEDLALAEDEASADEAPSGDGGGTAEASGGTDGESPAGAEAGAGAAEAAGNRTTDLPDVDVEDLPEDPDELRQELETLTEELEELQGESPLVPVFVDAEVISQVVSGWTGIPVGKMLRDEVETVLSLEEKLGERVVGQDHALEIISHRIRTSRAGIEDPRKPVGVFLLVGPSGVGKTETALALSDTLFGGEENVISINMSEFQESHTVSSLKGAPPGYVGYGEGGVLTEAVRRRPYSVVLLDEIEKAHPDVHEVFFQVFDKGVMEDGEGRKVDFKNTVLIMTSNVGTDTIMSLTADPETAPDMDGLRKAIRPDLDEVFQAAFLGRTVVVPYFPLGDDVLRRIVDLKVEKIQRRLRERHGTELVLDGDVYDEIAARCTEVESGARNIDNILTNTVLPSLSRLLLRSLVDQEAPARLRVGVGDDGNFRYEETAAGA